jgi:putative ABC transport system permease protein
MFARWKRRSDAEHGMADEFRFHLEVRTEDLIRSGLSRPEAMRRASIEFGGIENYKERCREARGHTIWDNLRADFRYAARTFAASRGFALTAVLTLALGIGASTAIFSVTNAVLLQPLPYRDAGRLVLVFWESSFGNIRNLTYSNADFLDLQAGTHEIFEDFGGVASLRAFVPREDGSTEQVGKAMVTTNFFRLMGARIALGRDFIDSDAVPQPAEPGVLIPPGSAAILSYEYWQRHYGGSTSVLGQEIVGAGQPGPRIVGVLAPGFKLYFPPAARVDEAPDFWVANNIGYDAAHRNLLAAGAIGRLKNGIGLAQAQLRLDALRPQIRRSSFDPAAPLSLEPMREYLVDDVRTAILSLMGAVVFLLLIACANVANLLLVRSSLRQRELAVRSALGGSRRRLVSQMLTEALVLSGLGTAVGIALAWAAIRGFLAIAPANLPRAGSAGIDWRVLLFAAAAGLASVAVFGVMPALRAARPDLIRTLRARGRNPALGGGQFLRSGVAIAEVALSFVLLVGSGLMFRTFVVLRHVDPGYDPHGLLTFFVTKDWSFTRQQGRIELLREIQARLSAIPGVESATATLMLPLGGGPRPKLPPSAAPRSTVARAEDSDMQQVMPGYFETLRTPLLAGRTFTAEDNAPGRNLAVIDQQFAASAFPNGSPIGQRIELPGPGVRSVEVIGVVGHQRLGSLSDPGRGIVYFSDGFWGIGVSRYWMLRTAGDPAKYAAAVRAELAKLDRGLVISKVQPMDALVDQDQSGTRLSLLLLGTFAAIALLLAGVGLYAVLSTVVRQRTAEIGVRMALGAEPAWIFRMVVGQGLRLTAAGLAMGLMASLALTRLIAAMLVGVRATDPSTFAAMTVLFLLVAAIASWVPAARAASLDANAALREE